VEKTLDVLKEHGVDAAFFLLKNFISSRPDVTKRIADEGHLICNHTLSHRDMSKVEDIGTIQAELDGLGDFLKETTGYEMTRFYRPPEGKYTESNLKMYKQLGYKTIFWSAAYADWDQNNQPDPERAKSILRERTHNGCVLLLHPTSKTNALILSDMIREWKAEGYRFGTLEELTACDG